MNESELKSFIQLVRVLWRYDFEFTVPDNISTNEYTNILKINNKHNYVINRAEPKLFTLKGFNEDIMLKKWFWDKFSDYEYVLHYELDSFVFRDELELWCDKGYDYIGAPWMVDFSDKHELWKIGNGGFTLVKTETMRKFLSVEHDNLHGMWDNCICLKNHESFKLPDCREAMKFSFEKSPSWLFTLNDKKLPFGCHKWWAYEYDKFWRNII